VLFHPPDAITFVAPLKGKGSSAGVCPDSPPTLNPSRYSPHVKGLNYKGQRSTLALRLSADFPRYSSLSRTYFEYLRKRLPVGLATGQSSREQNPQPAL